MRSAVSNYSVSPARGKRHIFLTGERQVGKSTALSKAVELLNVTPAGFKTKWLSSERGGEGSADVMLFPADKSPEDGVCVVHRSGAGNTVYAEVFDRFGPLFLKRSAELIVMDELGFFESSAELFQRAVFEMLDGATPVLGVLRCRHTPFLDAIRARSDVVLMPVTCENREFVPEKIGYFMNNVMRGRG